MTRAAVIIAVLLAAAQVGESADSFVPAEYDPATSEIKIDSASLNDVEKKLAEIVIPVVDFRQADIRDIVYFFDQCVKQFGGPAQQDDGSRICFVHHFPDGAVPRPVIAFALKNVPLLYALRLTASLGDYEYTIEGRTVTVLKKAAPLR